MAAALEVIARYLADAISAEKNLQTQFRGCSKDGDDSDVQNYFESSATLADEHVQMLEKRLAVFNGTDHRSSNILAGILAMAPKAAQIGHIAEERITQNLIKGFSLTKSACAMYLALQAAARAADDEQTAYLANRLADEQATAAERFWHFLPSRSKIAYNVLTAGEVDPAVETRAPDDRVTETPS